MKNGMIFAKGNQWLEMTSLIKKGAALPIRLTEDEKKQLTAIACETGLTVSTVVRILIESFIRHYHENGGQFTLPISWREILTS